MSENTLQMEIGMIDYINLLLLLVIVLWLVFVRA